MSSLKKILTVLSLLLLAAACNKQPVSGNPQAPDAMAGWQTYRNIDFSSTFEFKYPYPKGAGFVQPTYGHLENQVVQVNPNRFQVYQGTNYIDSGFTVSTTGAKNLDACLAVNDSAFQKNAFIQSQIINGATFYKASGTDAAAGNIYNYEAYRTFFSLPLSDYPNNLCLEIDLTVHTANVGNYSKEQHIKELDQSEPMAVLRQMLSTFKFDQ